MKNAAPGASTTTTKVANLAAKLLKPPTTTTTVATNPLTIDPLRLAAALKDPASLMNPFVNPFMATNFEPQGGDLNDPTDPACPFPRPLPPGGARIVLQMLDLPANAMRHEIRLYLGPAHFAKVCRMVKVVSLGWEKTNNRSVVKVSNGFPPPP